MTITAETRVCACTQPVVDGYACATCTAAALARLYAIADLSSGLGEKRARLGAVVYRHGRSTNADTPMPYDPRVTAVERATLADLRAVAYDVWEHTRPPVWVDAGNVGAVALWLTSHLDWIRTRPGAAAKLRRIETAHDKVTHLFDVPPAQLYLGECRATHPDDTRRDHPCPQPLYVDARTATVGAGMEAEAATVTCRRCEAAHDVRARRGDIAAALGDYQATMTELVRLSPILTASGVSHARLKRLSAAHTFNQVGERAVRNTRGEWRRVPTYRIADVQHAIEAGQPGVNRP